MNYAHLGQRIKEERIKLNLTQSQLAEDIDISDSYMGYIERGERSLTLETLVKIARRFGVSIDYLMQDTVPPKHENIINQFRILIDTKTPVQQQMGIDVLKTMYSYIDK